MLASLPPVYVTFKLEPEPTTVYQGHTAMFQCQAEGDPVPHIQWKGKDKILDPSKLLPRYTASIPSGTGFSCPLSPARRARTQLSPCLRAWALLASAADDCSWALHGMGCRTVTAGI